MFPLLSRRSFLALSALGALSPAEWKRYPDPATELEIVRLTDPAFPSGMTAPHLRQFTRHSDWLLYWSERSGSRQAYLANLKTGESELLTDAAALDPSSLSLSTDEKSFFFFDGPTLCESPFPKLAPRALHKTPDGALRSGFTLAPDGSVYFAESASGRTSVQRTLHGQTRRAFDLEGPVDQILARPGNPKSRLRLVWRQSNAWWASGTDGAGRQRLALAPGQNGQLLWSPSGTNLTYLHIPENSRELTTLREHNPDTGADTQIATTSQFISATPNADASVFAAASRSVASPYVLIMLRKTRRELTLAEHRASDAAMVQPVFTPDSRKVLFVSDRHGKSAVYVIGVAGFVEETGADDTPKAPAPAGPLKQRAV